MATRFDVGAAALLAAAVLLAFWQPLAAMVQQWDASPMYAYAYMVPVLSACLLWARRADIAALQVRPKRLLAVPVLIASGVLVTVGEAGSIQVLQQLAFPIALAGIVLFCFGSSHLRIAAPAIVYLVFMVPLWEAFTEPLHAPFQARSAWLGIALMHLVGVPAFRDGVVIALPNVTIEVARACSGVNYLIAVLALALPTAVLRLRSASRRVVLVAFALAIAVLANGLRVALIGTLAYYEVGSPLHGPFHVLHGLFVAGIGFVALFVGLRILQSPADQAPAVAAPIAAASSCSPGLAGWRPLDAVVLAVAILFVWAVGVARPLTPVALAAPLDSLPAQLGPWSMDRTAVARRQLDEERSAIDAWPGSSSHLARVYRSTSGRAVRVVQVDVWYFEAQSQGQEIVNPHAASIHRGATPVRIVVDGGRAIVADRLWSAEQRTLGLLWYDFDGQIEATQNGARVRGLWNALAARRNNAAVALVRSAAGSARDETASGALENVAGELDAHLQRLWAREPQLLAVRLSPR